ncbi:Tetraacyldisaccharide 4'-kinase [Caenispirillum salinarum AK4]|uniref:Tetraacyldisaccharide 4'-kinase n=1 Tax=Caenispirillum salinarum AK4 TaxID=1238182 RepID=K9H4J9_9PROT|nr:tetraacyldisaccharide 4'-kinase [Caenispirillum salinarum]EKV32497.1 Tetraacyldisaccharide 4'-kinase [Caenispirillum salinarum AK4]
MRAPEFWRTQNGIVRLLEPAGLLYAAAGRLRRARTTPHRAGIPVACVGNIVAGGAGKTPVCLSLADALTGAHFLTRGYGGSETGPLAVDLDRHTPEDVGDEALLLADRAPTWVARRRPEGAAAAEEAGARCLIMDDGHQNPTLAKDLSLVVVDGGYGFGNRRVLPAGPLREPLAEGLARADGVVLMGDDTARVARRLPPDLPVLRARLEPGRAALRLRGQLVVAFAGIGRPDKFFATLVALGARVVAAHPFADHFPYRHDDIQPILDEAFQLGAIPVTTAKDAVRLPPDQRQQVDVVPVTVRWEDPPALRALLTAKGLPVAEGAFQANPAALPGGQETAP